MSIFSQLHKLFLRTAPLSGNAGFSVLELIITISIFVVLTTGFLLNYNSFNKRITLDTLAQEIAQWARETQISAMGVKRSSAVLSTHSGYGLHFDIATPDRFIYFADRLANQNRYDAGTGACGTAGTECERVVMLPVGNVISALCGETSSNGATCTGGVFKNSNVFDVVFTRPNPDASILGDLSGSSFPTAYSRARITVTSVKGYSRTIEIWTTGQITVL
jgi:type II secretory pathway pseudopilin PulG